MATVIIVAVVIIMAVIIPYVKSNQLHCRIDDTTILFLCRGAFSDGVGLRDCRSCKTSLLITCNDTLPCRQEQSAFQEKFLGMRRDGKPVQKSLHQVVLKNFGEWPALRLGMIEQTLADLCSHILDGGDSHRTASK